MKKEVILEALSNLGVAIPEDKQKEFITAMQIANGVDITSAKKDYDDKVNELAELKGKYDADLKRFQKGGENFIDREEYNSLKKYKEDTENKERQSAQTSAIEKLVGDEKYHFDKKAIKLLGIAARESGLKFNDKNEIENADEIMSKLTQDYGDYVVSRSVNGATPAPAPKQTPTVDLDKMSFDEYKKFRNQNNGN